MNLKLLRDLQSEQLTGKTVFVRVDWNVPIQEGKVVDGFRIMESLPTLEFLAKNNCQIKIATHLSDSGQTIEPLINFLHDHFNYDHLEMFPNLRSDSREEANDQSLAEELAAGCDFYVNEAFSVCHRKHASVVLLPQLLPAYAGLRLEREVKELSTALNPERPFLFLLGGAKFGTKLPLLQKYLKLADQVFVGGALANSLLKAKGVEVGQSLIDNEALDLNSIISEPNLILPTDVVVGDKISKAVTTVTPTETIMDVGENSINELARAINEAKLIVWNGPMGNYEKGFTEATASLAKLVANAPVRTIVGGGDTLAVINSLSLANDFDFVSTGGGAMLDFLTYGTLPGLTPLLLN